MRNHFGMARRTPTSAFASSVALVMVLALTVCTPAWAYRPFDGTDAAVADVGEAEIELQPAGAKREGSTTTLVAPAVVLNFGFADRWEAVFEGRGETPLSPGGPTNLADSGVFLKHVLRPGSLQDKEGVSIATEFGVLLPDSLGASGTGASLAFIVSQRFDWGTVHFNAVGELTRDQHADAFLDVILEGPAKWPVRPVAEFFYERTFNDVETVSALVGAIWQVRDNLSFDIGLREAFANGRPITEIRAGMTFGFPLHFGGKNGQTASESASRR